MTNTIILVCGVQATGKSWLCRQLTHDYTYIAHDRCWTHPLFKPDEGSDPVWQKGATSTHLETIIEEAGKSSKPILTEVPFGETALLRSLTGLGFSVTPVYVIADPEDIVKRYEERELKPLPKGVLQRNATMKLNAIERGRFFGTSSEVLNYLKLNVFETIGD